MLHNVRYFLSRLLRAQLAQLVVLAALMPAPVHAADPPPLAAAVIHGSTVYPAPELFPVYGNQLGRPITREVVQGIASAIAEKYQRDGYSRPDLKVREELIPRGIVRIDIYEPRITRVTIAGNAGRYQPQLETLGAELQTERPVRPGEVQRVLRDMRALPGITIAARTRRDATRPDGHELLIDATFKPVDNLIRLTNRATEEIGPYFVVGQVVGNGLLGHEEKLGLLFTAAQDLDEYRGVGLFGDLPVGSRGTHAMLMGFESRSDPSEEPDDLDELYRRHRVTLSVTHPVVLESGFALSFSGSFDMDNLKVERAGSDLRDDRLRIVELGTRLGWRDDSSTQYTTALQFRKGLNGFGSQLRADDLVDDPRDVDFLLVRWQLTRLTRVDDLWSIRLDGLAQQTRFVLPDSERFKIGGDRLGRGFEITEIAGDQGLGGKIEVRRELPGRPSTFGKTSVYGFYDIGAAWRHDVPDRQSAATAGTGIALRTERLSMYLELAKPLTHADVDGNKDLGLFAEITLGF